MKDIKLSQEDFGLLAIYAIRYCHGRMSYAPSQVMRILRPHLQEISDKDLGVMINDCDYQAITQMYGDMKIDKPDWLRWKDDLEAERKRRNGQQRTHMQTY